MPRKNFSGRINKIMHKRRVIIFLLVILLAFLFWYSAPLQNIFYDSVSIANDYTDARPVTGVIIFIALAAISAIFSLFSSVALVPAAIMIWGGSLTLTLLLAGWIIGDIIAYFIGAYALRNIAGKFIPIEKIDQYRGKISKKTEFGLILLFRIAMPTEIAGYLLGVIKYHFGKYFLATFLSELPFALLAVYAGDALITQDVLTFIALIALGIAIAIITIELLHKKIKAK